MIFASRSQRMISSPPSSFTVTSSSVLPFKMQATAVAQVPVPQASVSPVPRSHTRIFAYVGLTSSTNSALTRRGKIGLFSNSGPTSSNGKLSTSSTKLTQCGLPMDTQVMRYSFPATMIGSSCTISPASGRSTGTSSGARIGAPILTRTSSTVFRPFFSSSPNVNSRYLIPASVSMDTEVLSVSP